MPLNRKEKESVVKELKEDFEQSAGVVLTDYKGLQVPDINQLRNYLRKKEIKYKVFKNTLIKRATTEAGLADFTKDLNGCTAIAFSKSEPILTVKLLYEFFKENKEKFKLKRALVDGQMFSEDQLGRIADLPTKEELLSKLLGYIKFPINSFVWTLRAPISGLVNVIDQIRKKKEENEE